MCLQKQKERKIMSFRVICIQILFLDSKIGLLYGFQKEMIFWSDPCANLRELLCGIHCCNSNRVCGRQKPAEQMKSKFKPVVARIYEMD